MSHSPQVRAGNGAGFAQPPPPNSFRPSRELRGSQTLSHELASKGAVGGRATGSGEGSADGEGSGDGSAWSTQGSGGLDEGGGGGGGNLAACGATGGLSSHIEGGCFPGGGGAL